MERIIVASMAENYSDKSMYFFNSWFFVPLKEGEISFLARPYSEKWLYGHLAQITDDYRKEEEGIINPSLVNPSF